jgi:hypothetical protein
MIYNPEKQIDIQNAITKIKYFIDKKAVFELKKKQVPKTYPQLKYVHLILGWFALEYGETVEHVKLEYFKKLVNPETFEYEFINRKTGEVRQEYKSLATITKEEMTLSINKFRDYSSKEAGIYLPQPSDLVILQEIEIQIKNNQHYL